MEHKLCIEGVGKTLVCIEGAGKMPKYCQSSVHVLLIMCYMYTQLSLIHIYNIMAIKFLCSHHGSCMETNKTYIHNTPSVVLRLLPWKIPLNTPTVV